MKMLALMIITVVLIPMPFYIWWFETSTQSLTRRKIFASVYFLCFLVYMAIGLYRGSGADTAEEFFIQGHILIWTLFGGYQFIKVWQAIK